MTTMRKMLTIITTILSSLIILDTFQFGDAIAMFLLAGVIPGTNLALSPTVALELFALLLGFVISRLVITARQSAQLQRA